MDKPNKPITLVRSEFIDKMANLINQSGLPSFIIEPILQNFLNETRIDVQRQIEIDKAQYENELKAYETHESES